MICPVCSNSGERSIVRITGTKQPKVPKEHFWDEDGNEHYHDPNIVRTQFRCSSGHRFEEVSSWQCAVEGCDFLPCVAKVTVIGGDPAVETVQS